MITKDIIRKKVLGIFILLLPLILEVFLFNYYAVYTGISGKYLKDNYIEPDGIKVSDNFEMEDNGILKAVGDGEYYLEVTDLDLELNNIFLDAELLNNRQEPIENTVLEVALLGKDEGSALYYYMGKRDLVPSIEKSKWIKTHFYGKVDSIKIVLNIPKNSEIKINKLGLNGEKPVYFSLIRVIILYVILYFFWLIRSKSIYWNKTCLEIEKKEKLIILSLILICIFMVIGVYKFNDGWRVELSSQYLEMMKSMEHGKAYVMKDVPDFLKEITNPYDMYLRKGYESSTGETVKWDYAYYNGKYYVYFGLLPMLLYQLPYKIITDKYLPLDIVTLISSILAIIFIYKLTFSIMKKYFNKASFALYLLLATNFALGCGVITCIRRPEIYEACISTALMLTVLGLDMWINSIDDRKGKLNYVYLFMGSLFVASTAAVRPQFLLSILFATIIGRTLFVKDKKICILKNWKAICIFAVPFIVVAAAVMWYNAIRFGSIFDFGANYNITTNDMTKRGWNLSRVVNGIYEYLIRPLKINNQFPFLHVQELNTSYIGNTIYENKFGGILFMNCVLVLNFAVFKLKKYFKNNMHMYYWVVIGIVSSFVVIAVDSNMAGILERYQIDFSWMLFIGSIIVASAIDSEISIYNRKIWRNIIISAVLINIVVNTMAIWSEPVWNLYEQTPINYSNIKYLFEFWL